MFVAHLPAAYLLGRALPAARASRTAARAVLVGGLFPDVDLLWAYGVKHGTVHHHALPTHLPAVWLVVGAAALAVAGRHRPLVGAFLWGVALHLLLDSFVGDVKWAWPWSDAYFHVVTVPAQYRPWILSFVLHWTFLVELAICAAAALSWRGARRRDTTPAWPRAAGNRRARSSTGDATARSRC